MTNPAHDRAIGIDVGGTGVKGAVLDGGAAGAVVRAATPSPARIDDVTRVIGVVASRLLEEAGEGLPIGVALSGDVRDGRHTSGVNLHASWVDAPARDLIRDAVGRDVAICNDADAAAIGEAAFGAAVDVRGVVVVLTFGTGIGSGILMDGRLLPNSGLGQLPYRGRPVERLLSAVARERRGLDWADWAAEVTRLVDLVDLLLRPELVVVGGGVVNAFERFGDAIRASCPVVPALLGDRAGIVGAGLVALGRGAADRPMRGSRPGAPA